MVAKKRFFTWGEKGDRRLDEEDELLLGFDHPDNMKDRTVLLLGSNLQTEKLFVQESGG